MYLSEESMGIDDSDDEEWVDGDGNAFDLIEINELNDYCHLYTERTFKVFLRF